MNTPKDTPAITVPILCALLSRPVCSLNEGTAAVYGNFTPISDMTNKLTVAA